MTSKFHRLAIAALIVALAVPAALASGFHVYEQGAKASGQGGAFIARADDASAAFYNPAAVANQEGLKIDFGFSAIFLGNTKLESNAGTTAGNPLYGVSGFFQNGTYDMDDHTPTPIHLGIAYRFANTPFAMSFAVTNPFGLITDWSSDPKFVGRYSAWRTDMRTFDYQLNGSMNFGGGWAGSIGIDYLYVDLRSFSKWVAVPVQNPGVPGVSPYFIANTLQDLEGTGHKIGWNAALHYKNPTWSFGAVYKSAIDVEADGNASFTNINVVDPALGDVLPATVKGAVVAGVAASLPSGPAKGTLRLPATWGLGVAYVGIPKWQFEFDVHRIEWSHFDAIPVDFQNNTTQLRDQEVPENWESTTSFRLGGSYDVSPNIQARLGVYRESNPIPASTLRPSIPDGKRTGASAGLGMQFGNIAVDLYYLHIFVTDETVNLSDTTASPAPIAAAIPLVLTNNAGEIGRTGTYKSGINLLGLTLSYKF